MGSHSKVRLENAKKKSGIKKSGLDAMPLFLLDDLLRSSPITENVFLDFRLVTKVWTYPLKSSTTVSKNNLDLTKLRLFLRPKVNMMWAELWPKIFWTDLG